MRRPDCLLAPAAAIVGLLALVPVSSRAEEATYPSRPIHLIVPFAAGGAADMVARLVAQSLGEKLGQPMVVENRPGATGTIGSLAVARAAPDGYTILMTVISSHAVQPVLKKQPPFDPIADFTPIVRIANSIQTLVVRTSLPVSNVAELIAYAKKNPGKVTYGSSGVGSFPHLGGKMMEREAGIDMVHVPFSGDAPAMNAVISGTIDILFTPSARSYVDGKTVKLIGISSLKRSPATPDWPTLDETGLPKFELVSWVGLMGPAHTPSGIVARLNKATNEALADPLIQSRLEQIGYSAAGGSPQDFVKQIENDIARFKALHISID
jgi:tripartite-type tricarboxylate transporter receptor subunit TctC